MSKHTPEPWSNKIGAGSVFGHDGYIVTSFCEETRPMSERIANANRIVSCVNALAGINPKAVKPMLEACNDAVYVLDKIILHPAYRLEKLCTKIKEVVKLAEEKTDE